MYKNILVPHAGTKAGNRALEHAHQIAKLNNSKITLLHIVEEIPTPPLVTLTQERKNFAKQLNIARREMKIEMHKRMDKLVQEIRSEKIPTSVKILHGYPDEEISRIANSGSYDLIIMAKRKKLPGIKGILKLGSISRKVLEQISCPIMLIDGERK